MKHPVPQQYQNQYRELGFERAGLFEVLSKRFPCTQVLYPGSSVHITPSFFFPHVVYADQSEVSRTFFTDLEPLLRFIEGNKRYRQSSYLRFLDEDYTQGLSLRAEEYDLLIALFADDVILCCTKYVRPGGLILSNDYHGDAQGILSSPDFALEARIRCTGKAYEITPATQKPSEAFRQTRGKARAGKDLVCSGARLEYRDLEMYYLIRKLKRG